MRTCLITIALAYSIFCAAQPAIEWRQNLGGSDQDESRSIVTTADGGYFHVGRSKSSDLDIPSNQGDYDLSVMKLSSVGEVVWSKAYGGSGFDSGFGGMECFNGDFIVIGYTNSTDGDVVGNHGDYDIWILRLDASGSIIWQITFGGSGADLGLCIRQTMNGDFIASGTSASSDGDIVDAKGDNDMVAIRISADGNIEWKKNIGGSAGDRGWNIIELAGGNFVLAGDSGSLDGDMPDTNNGEADAVAVFIDDDGVGTVTGVYNYGGTGNDEARFVGQKPNGDLVFSGATLSGDGQVTNYHGGYDFWVFCADVTTGEFLWGDAFGGSANEYARFMHVAPNGDVLTGGYADSADGDILFSYGGSDAFLIRVNGDDGTLRWGFNYGGAGNDLAYGACNTSSGGFVITTASNSIDGDIYNPLGNNDYWIFSLENDGVSVSNELIADKLFVSPNPSSGIFAVKTPENFLQNLQSATVSDLAGRTVALTWEPSGNGLELDLRQLPAGLYNLRLVAGEDLFFAKLVVQKQ